MPAIYTDNNNLQQNNNKNKREQPGRQSSVGDMFYVAYILNI